MSQAKLARLIDMSQQSISALENGRVQRLSKLRELSIALGRSEAWLLGEIPLESLHPMHPPNAGPPIVDVPSTSSVPVLGFAVAGTNGRFILNGQAIGQADRPARLNGVPDAYAVYVYGTSMSPRFEPGETVFVHPYAPVVQGNYVVVQTQPEHPGDAPYGYVKRFVTMDDRRLVLEQWNPGEGENRRLEFDRRQVISIHKIVSQDVL